MKDPYVYENGVLINKLNIKDDQTLKAREAEITYAKLLNIENVEGRYDYDHLKKMHSHIFSDVYSWAGKERTIPIEKPEKVLNGISVQYTLPKEIKRKVNKIIKKLHQENWNVPADQQAKLLSKYTASLWQVHPFREGNTRTTVNFITSFANENGMTMDKALLKQHASFVRNALVMASIGEYSETNYLEQIFKDSRQRGQALCIEEIANAPNPSELNRLSDKRTIYYAYAKSFIEDLKSGKNCDEPIMKQMLKDGKDKTTILSALSYSPFNKLSRTDKMIELRNLFNKVAKEPEIKKLLSRDLSRS